MLKSIDSLGFESSYIRNDRLFRNGIGELIWCFQLPTCRSL